MSELLDLIDLAAEKLGGTVLHANDDFFAPKENLLKPKAAIFLEHEYTDRGKWMDGWESRRRRTPGHDWCLIRLGLPGIVRGVVVDTAFFRGNYPDHCSIEACSARADASPEELCAPETRWVEVLPKSGLRGDSKNVFPIDSPHRFTHLRLNIFPDGGVARLRVHGEVVPDWRSLGKGGAEIDVAAVESGAQAIACSDMFFGVRHNLIMPGRAANMGDGWETKRRRGPGHDWSLLRLCAEATLRRIEVDTNHFKGNYPDTAMIEGIAAEGASVEELAARSDWREILPRTKLQPHTRHLYEPQLVDRGPFTHVRLNIYPDGGVSRLRLFGALTREGSVARRVYRLDTLLREEAEAELLACCGAHAWARGMAARRPFQSLAEVLSAADAVWRGLAPSDWLEAFRAHPRIGEKQAPHAESAGDARAQGWAEKEQGGMSAAAAETVRALAEGNRAYDARFGHIFIVCATGKSADEMLALLRARLDNEPATELALAAEEQRKITRIRLEKLLGS
jgi:allantoicase